MGVMINEAGADFGTATVIAVPADQKIHLNKAWEGTIIKVGTKKYIFKDTRKHVRAYLDEGDRLRLS